MTAGCVASTERINRLAETTDFEAHETESAVRKLLAVSEILDARNKPFEARHIRDICRKYFGGVQ